ncbi:cobalamin biosynthesis protein [Desulfovibrio sp. OttesenSCG-928-C06]|nr:cobalamin biosynthesis protein [Desulfovibrio sp. OttesenSCG-928-C06]
MLSQAAIYALTPQGAALALKVAAAIEQSGSYSQPSLRIFLSSGLAQFITDQPGILSASSTDTEDAITGNCVPAPDTQAAFQQAVDTTPQPAPLSSSPVFFERISEQLAANFNRFSCHILICASGIALRSLAPLLASKDKDPAVLLLDQRGNFVISLLSGHLGGANRAARELAGIIGATPVITTATDCEDLPALDELAAQKNLRIENLSAVRAVNSALLRGEKPWLLDCENRLGLLGSEHEKFFRLWDTQTADTVIGENSPKNEHLWDILPEPASFLEKIRNSGQTAVLVDPPEIFSSAIQSDQPEIFSSPDAERPCLILRSKKIWMGLGCKRGVTPEAMEQFVSGILAENSLSWSEIAGIASIDIKSDEAAILELARRQRLPLRFFKAEELDAVPVPGLSERVRQATGTASVCEAAALLAAGFTDCGPDDTPDSNVDSEQHDRIASSPDYYMGSDESGSQSARAAADSQPEKNGTLSRSEGTGWNGKLILPKQKGPGITVALARAC